MSASAGESEAEMSVDFSKTADDYARHRAGFPDALFGRLSSFGIGSEGQRVLDVGTGTGTLARGFARRGCRVTGLDRSAELMAQARNLDVAAGVDVAYVVASAEDTAQKSGAFDVFSAGQCWHWFDGPRAAAEARRVLVGGGALVIAHFDWVPLAGNVVAMTERLIEAHNPSWKFGGGTGIYPAWFAHAREAGFEQLESFTFDVGVPYSHEDWRGRIRASAGVGASLAPAAVAAFDAVHATQLADEFPEGPLSVLHRVFALVARAPLD